MAKLGFLRQLTENAMQLWHDEIIALNNTNPAHGYYYQTYLRQIVNRYDDYRKRPPVVVGLDVHATTNVLLDGCDVVKATQNLTLVGSPIQKTFGPRQATTGTDKMAA